MVSDKENYTVNGKTLKKLLKALIFSHNSTKRSMTHLQAIRDEKLAQGAKLIALTNQSDDAEKNRAQELGADHYIIKASMIPSEVVAAVGEQIAKK
jgi:DNA-binding NarL/FixJ family response regulator